MGKSKTKELVAQMREHVMRVGYTGNSKEDQYSIMDSLINDISYERIETVSSKNGDVEVVTYPVEDFRKSLIPVLVKAGLDVNEASKIAMEQELPKNCAASLTELAKSWVTEYLDTGRKLTLPSGEKDATLGIKKTLVEETTRPVFTDVLDENGNPVISDGKKVREKNGTVTTKEHYKIVGVNTTRPSQKTKNTEDEE